MKPGVKGAILAGAVAVMFLASHVQAQEASSSGSSAAAVKCVGGNDCKGKGSCKGAGHDCKGQNACKGKGFVETSSADDCTAKGGKAQ